MAFTPYGALAALVGVPVIAVTQRWGATAVAAVTAAVLVACVLPRALADSDPQAGTTGPDLRVATANIYLGAVDPAEVLRLVRDQRIDVLAVQETTEEWLARADTAGLGALLAHRVVAAGGKAGGSGLFSRYELRAGGSRLIGDGWVATPEGSLRSPRLTG